MWAQNDAWSQQRCPALTTPRDLQVCAVADMAPLLQTLLQAGLKAEQLRSLAQLQDQHLLAATDDPWYADP